MPYVVIIFIALLLSNCQTISKKQKNAEKILSSQKSIIVSYLNSGLPSQAHGELRKILEENPHNVDFIELMGVTQLALQNYDKAVFYLRQAYQQNGKIKTALNLSSALIATGSLAQAQRLLLTLLREEGDHTYQRIERIYHNLGLIYQKRGDLKRAEHYYRKAVTENPSYYLTLLNLGLMFKQQRRYQDAITWLLKAQNFCRKCLEPVRHLSTIYLLQHKQQQAFTVVDTYSRQAGLNLQERQAAITLRQRLQKSSR